MFSKDAQNSQRNGPLLRSLKLQVENRLYKLKASTMPKAREEKIYRRDAKAQRVNQ
jgi:hypothetical protein